MPIVLETEPTLPPQGGIFLKSGLISQDVYHLALDYEGILEQSKQAQAELDISLPADETSIASYRASVMEYINLCRPEITSEEARRKQFLGCQIDALNTLMREANLAHDSRAIIKRHTNELVQSLMANNQPGDYMIGQHQYWLTTLPAHVPYLFGEFRMFFRRAQGSKYPLIYYSDAHLPTNPSDIQPPNVPLDLGAEHRLATVADHIILLEDLAELPGSIETPFTPAALSRQEQRIVQLMGGMSLIATQAEIGGGAQADGNNSNADAVRGDFLDAAGAAVAAD